MRPTFDQWIRDSRYRGYDRTVHAMLREAYRAGGQSDELDRAAELLRRIGNCVESIITLPGEDDIDWKSVKCDIDAFLRDLEAR